MQKKAELIGGPYDGVTINIKKDPIVTYIAAGKNCIHQYSLEERFRDNKTEWFYNYNGQLVIGDKRL